MSTPSVRIDDGTHRELVRLAEDLQLSLGETVRYAVTRLQQAHAGDRLRAPLTPEEVAWLDADLG